MVCRNAVACRYLGSTPVRRAVIVVYIWPHYSSTHSAGPVSLVRAPRIVVSSDSCDVRNWHARRSRHESSRSVARRFRAICGTPARRRRRCSTSGANRRHTRDDRENSHRISRTAHKVAQWCAGPAGSLPTTVLRGPPCAPRRLLYLRKFADQRRVVPSIPGDTFHFHLQFRRSDPRFLWQRIASLNGRPRRPIA